MGADESERVALVRGSDTDPCDGKYPWWYLAKLDPESMQGHVHVLLT